MIFFSSDQDFEIFYKVLKNNGLDIDVLVTESPKKQGRDQTIKPNPAHAFAQSIGLKTLSLDILDENSTNKIAAINNPDGLGFIFAYGKIIPESIINLFPNGILNIHFSLLPEYPGASPIQQALLDNKQETGYTIFEITKNLDRGRALISKKIKILEDDSFDSLRNRIINEATEALPDLLKKYLNHEIKLSEISPIQGNFTHKISKEDGLISDNDSAQTAYNKIRAFSRWPKTYLLIDNKRYIIRGAELVNNRLKITEIQPEGKKTMSFEDFKNGYHFLLTKFPDFVNIS